MTLFRRITCIMMLFYTGMAYAQDNSIGTTWSFSGIGITYQHDRSDEIMACFDLKAETSDVFLGRTRYPGVSASFTWNIIFKESESANGNRIQIFAGPGFTAGAQSIIGAKNRTLFYGLKGRVGARCTYDRNVDISLMLAPVLGMQLFFLEEEMQMKFYHQGLTHGLMPEISITYRF